MPNMLDDGLIDQATLCHSFSSLPTNPDFLLQSAVSSAINTACAAGAFTASFNASATAQAIRELMIQRLVNMGYTASISGTTITANW